MFMRMPSNNHNTELRFVIRDFLLLHSPASFIIQFSAYHFYTHKVCKFSQELFISLSSQQVYRLVIIYFYFSFI